MDIAIVLLKGKKKASLLTIDAIKEGKVSEKDILDIRCFGCGEKAHVYHSKLGEISFRCEKHKDWCPEFQKESKEEEKYILKKKRIYSDTYTCLDLLLYGSDRAPKEPRPIDVPPIDNQEQPEEPKDDASNQSPEENGETRELTPEEMKRIEEYIQKLDPNTPDGAGKFEELTYYEFKIKNIKTMSPLFKEIKNVGYGFDMGDGRTAGDVLLDEYALRTIRRSGFEGSKIAILTRLKPEDISYLRSVKVISESKYDPMEYTYLKDAFSENIEDAVIFKIKCQNPKQNTYFKNMVMGSKRDNIKKDPRNYLVVFSFWKKISNSYMPVYSADITFRQYAFFSNVEIGIVNE